MLRPNGLHAAEIEALVRDDAVHRLAYVSPEVFDHEMTRLFASVWCYLGHESQIPAPDDYITTQLGRRPVILTRASDGAIHALFNRCTHRAARFCDTGSGSAKRFTCPYHGWTFSNDGSCVAVPFPKGYGPDFDRSGYDLGRIPRVESYRGFVFGTMSDDMPDLRTYLGRAAEVMDIFIDRSPTGGLIARNGAYRTTFRGNWKLVWDNAHDSYHPPFTHRSVHVSRPRHEKVRTHFSGDPSDTEMYVEDLGNGHTVLFQRPAMGPSLWKRARPTPGGEAAVASLSGRVGDDADQLADLLERTPGGGVNLQVFPNLLLIANQIQVVIPVDVDRTDIEWWATTLDGVPDEVNLLRMRIGEDFPNFGEVDDLVMFERCQEGLAVAEMEWVDMSRGIWRGGDGPDGRPTTAPSTDEMTLRAFWRRWVDAMTKVAADVR
ncbi:MAG: Rieske 2Fe-2S domain-containing protein [Acidimicrobiales bacterium]